MKLKDRVAIVTGSGHGIAAAIAELMAKEGAKVVVSDIDLPAAKQTVERIRGQGRQAHAVKTDVTRKAEVQAMAAEAKKTYGRIDILVNNAGTDKKGSIVDLPEETWDMLMNLNLKGTFLCTQAVMPTMIAQRYGRIVNISSMAGKTGEPLTSPYCATKFGVIGFTQAVVFLASEEAQFITGSSLNVSVGREMH